MSTQFEKVPSYVGCTPKELAAAKALYAKLSANPSHAMQSGYRRAALAAILNSGAAVPPLLYLEFSQVIPDGYKVTQRLRPRPDDTKTRREFEAAEKARIAAPHKLSQREAQNTLSIAAYSQWCAENQSELAKTVI
jgi:hypothetical protein